MPRVQWAALHKYSNSFPNDGATAETEIKADVGQKRARPSDLEFSKRQFLLMNCYSFGKHSAPIALR